MNKEIRCGHCNKLLAKGSFEEGLIEIKCVRCGTFHTMRATRPNLERQECPKEHKIAHSGQSIQRSRPV